MSDAQNIADNGIAEINACGNTQDLELIKARYMGKTGSLNALLKTLGNLPPDERKTAGAEINAQKERFQAAFAAKKDALEQAKLEAQLAAEALDVTLPGRNGQTGGLHPVTLTRQRVVSLFHAMGFEVADGPEIEDDFHNFQALNIPENHPARAMQDTFYVENGDVLRTHTSGIQIRYMLAKKKSADSHYCPRSRVSCGFGRNPLADVSPSRGFVGGKRCVVCRFESGFCRIYPQIF